jgi:hypothetical protein
MVQVLNNLSWVSAAHIVEAGMDFRHVHQSAFRDVQSRGFLNFSSSYLTGNALADLLLGFPLVTGAARLDNPQRLRAAAWSVFVQDRWKLRRNVSVAAGIRYEYAAPAVDSENRATLYDVSSGTVVPVGTGAMPRGGYEPDRNNWAPRLSVAWAPGNTETFVVRAGYGIYFNQGALATGEGLYFNPPFFDMTVNVPFPGVPPVTLHDPFPAAHPATLPPSATAYQRDFSIPWLEHWNVAVQQELGRSRALELAYVGSRGHNLISARDINQPAPGPALPNLRPNPLFSDITLIESRGSSDYNALQVKFQQRLYRGIALLGAYTFAKSTDDASGFFASTGDPNFPQDSRNPAAEHARSSFDIRHRFSMSFSGPLPLGYRGLWLTNHGLLSTILSDIELQGVVTLHTGIPFTVALLPEVDNSNTGRSTLGFGANDRPDLLGNPALDDPTSERWFDTTAFGLPQFGTFGNAGRNILDGPGYQNVNLGVLKNVYWGNARLQLRAEAFNLLNRPNYNLPDPFFGSPTFGRIVSAQNPRRWQFGVKLIF